MRSFIAFILILSLPAVARAGQPYLVSSLFDGNIWRIEDLNGDHDALDAGERTLWADGFTLVRGLERFGSAVHALEAGLAAGDNQVVRLIDLNRDGDALDIGERAVWADGLTLPVDIALGAAGDFYVSDLINGQVVRMADANGDGDALDTAEQTLFAEQLNGPSGLLPWEEGVLVTEASASRVARLQDLNGDGDALDVLEVATTVSGVSQPLGLLADGDGGFFVTSFDDDVVYRASDNNGDGDFFDIAEVLSYADSVFGALDGPASMSHYATGGILLGDYENDQVVLIRDINGDGDALDVGEVVTFADGIDAPIDIIAAPSLLPGDYNNDGRVDAADYVIWRKDPGAFGGQQGYDDWVANFGATAGSGSALAPQSRAAVPEPKSAFLYVVGGILLACRRGGWYNRIPVSAAPRSESLAVEGGFSRRLEARAANRPR